MLDPHRFNPEYQDRIDADRAAIGVVAVCIALAVLLLVGNNLGLFTVEKVVTYEAQKEREKNGQNFNFSP